MRSLSRMLTATFTPAKVKAPDIYRKVRKEAKILALSLGCTLDPCDAGRNVWPPALPSGVVDPYDGDHYAQNWEEVLVMLKTYEKLLPPKVA